MTPVFYILECILTSFQEWDFQWYNFNNVHSLETFHIIVMHSVA